MASLDNNLIFCDFFNDTSKCSDCIMSNVWLMSNQLKGEEIYGYIISFGYNSEGRKFDSQWCHWKFTLT